MTTLETGEPLRTASTCRASSAGLTTQSATIVIELLTEIINLDAECTMRKCMSPCSWFAFACCLLHALPTAAPAWAWGRLGHRVISRIAEKQLTPAAKAAIAELLEPGESLADASTWADEVRGPMRETAPWHYVDFPLDWPRYHPKFPGPTVGCVFDKINEFRKVVGDKSKSLEDRRFAPPIPHSLRRGHAPALPCRR